MALGAPLGQVVVALLLAAACNEGHLDFVRHLVHYGRVE